VSDDQNGIDARTTGQTLVNALKHREWDDGSKLDSVSELALFSLRDPEI